MKLIFVESAHKNPNYKTVYMGIELTGGVVIVTGHFVMTQEELDTFRFITIEGASRFMANETEVQWQASSSVPAFLEGVDATTV